MADASLFSFGPMKTGTALGGAITIVRDAAFWPPWPSAAAYLAEAASGFFTCRQIRRFVRLLRSLPAMALSCWLVGTAIRMSDVLRATMRNVGSGFSLDRFRQRRPCRCCG